MQELAAGLLAGRTVLLVTHDPAEAARLGHAILLMSPGGVLAMPPPAAPPVRAVDDPDTLACQGRLLAMLRSAA
jgi:putative hydroxymethylpyrimidine transport system ATP-binding protein